MNSGYSTTPRIQRLKLFCLKVLNIVSHVDNFQRLSLPTSWTGVLPSVKRPPCQKVVIWKFLTLYRQSNNAVGLRLFLEMGISITAYPVPRAPPAPLAPPAPWAPLAPLAISTCCSRVTSYPGRPSLALPISYKIAPNSVEFRPYAQISLQIGRKVLLSDLFWQLGPIMGSKMFINDFIGLKNDTNRPIEYSTY